MAIRLQVWLGFGSRSWLLTIFVFSIRLSAVNSALFYNKMLVVHVLPRLPAEDTYHLHAMSLTSKWQNNNVFSLRCNDIYLKSFRNLLERRPFTSCLFVMAYSLNHCKC